MGGEWSLGVALVMEIWPERHRPMLAGLIGAANNVGFLLIALIGMSFSVTQETWRWVVVIGALPALLVFWIVRYVPESERLEDRRRRLQAQGRSPKSPAIPCSRPRSSLSIQGRHRSDRIVGFRAMAAALGRQDGGSSRPPRQGLYPGADRGGSGSRAPCSAPGSERSSGAGPPIHFFLHRVTSDLRPGFSGVTHLRRFIFAPDLH